MADARLTALRGLSEVFGQGGYSNLVLESLMRNHQLNGQERAFCTALFYGVVERRITLDWVLGRYSRQPVEKLSPAVRDILRMAVYQLLYMPSVPESAAVNEAVKETRQRKVASAAGYVNGVLRAFLRDGKKIALPRIDAGDVTRLEAFREGLFHVQDLSSQKCAAALGVQAGHRVLDVCSAPGGKSFTLAEMMDDTGSLLAMDLYPNRLRLVEDGAARLGLHCIKTQARDAQIYDNSLGVFDRILCDVVCSGYGVIRRKPEIRYKDPAEAAALSETQLAILTASSRSLSCGGRLVYSTCTLNPAENEGVVERFLRENTDYALCGEPVTCLPEQNGGDGFFYAVVERRL